MAPTYPPGGTYNFLPLGPPHRYQTTTMLVSVYTQPRRHSCPWRFFTPKDMEDSSFFQLLDFESMAAPARAHPLILCTAYKQTTPLLSLALQNSLTLNHTITLTSYLLTNPLILILILPLQVLGKLPQI